MYYQGRFNVCYGKHSFFTDSIAAITWLLSLATPEQVSQVEIYEWNDSLAEYQDRLADLFMATTTI